MPPEQVGFRRGRTAEEHVGRLVQHVQDGWNRPKPRGRPVEGWTAERFVLLSFDFARAYDTIDHRMLKLKLLRLSLPRCLVDWIFQFLRDRRARVEVNDVPSEERPFRAGLPQGSVLAPSLFTLWSADLAAALRGIPGTTVLMYADDTATLSSGSTLPIARSRAQLAADTLAKWAITWKANIWRENSSPGPITVGPGRQGLPHQGRRRFGRGEPPPEDPRRDARPTSALRPTLLFHQEESQAAHRPSAQNDRTELGTG